MGRKQAQALLAALISTPLWAQDTGNLLINPGFQQGLSNWYETGPGGTYNGCGPAGGICYVFSYSTGVVQQAVVAPDTYTGYLVSFQYRLPCNNSIFGYCENPNGPRDWLSANLSLYLNDTPVQDVQLLSLQAYQPSYSTFSLSGSTQSPFNTATISFTGQDTGFWAGPYGPQIDNVSLSFSSPTPVAPEPEPVPVVPVPDAVDPAPDVTPDPTETQTEVLQSEPEQEAVVEQVVAEEEMIVEEAMPEEDIVSDDIVEQEEVEETQAEDANDEPLSPAELAALAAGDTQTEATADEPLNLIEVEAPVNGETSSAPSEEEVTQAVDAVATEAAAAEAARTEQQSQSGPEQTAAVIEARRDRNADFFQKEAIEDADTFSRETVMQASLQNVAFLAQADAQYAQQFGEQSTTDTVAETYSIQPAEGPTFAPAPTTGMGDMTTPVGQAQQMELLNMGGMQGDMAAGPVIDVGDVNSEDGETMAQLATVPAGYSAYTQARIPDNPFYQPRDIYKGRRIPDANLVLYRMMRGQDRLWNDMVEDQYE